MKPVVREILKNFLIPTIISIAWASYKVFINKDEDAFATFVTNFSASLFLLSWAFNQYKRAQKQIDDKSEFDKIKKELTNLLESISQQAEQIAGYALGDETSLSFKAELYPTNDECVSISISNNGRFPVYDINIQWRDLDNDNPIIFGLKNYNQIDIPSIRPKTTADNTLLFSVKESSCLRLNFSITTRNGAESVNYSITRKSKDSINLERID